MPADNPGEDVVGLLLAGGQARRMGGGDKCLRKLGGQTLLAHAITRAQPQVSRLLLNANGDPKRFADYGLTVIADTIDGFAGPLAGVLSGMTWIAEQGSQASWLATFPTDAPFFPTDLVARMRTAVADQRANICCAMSGGRAHPVFALWHISLRDDLEQAMVRDGVRKIDAWTATHDLVEVDYRAEPIDPFFNANRLEDLETAASWLADAEVELG